MYSMIIFLKLNFYFHVIFFLLTMFFFKQEITLNQLGNIVVAGFLVLLYESERSKKNDF